MGFFAFLILFQNENPTVFFYPTYSFILNHMNTKEEIPMESRMQEALAALKKNISGLRTGRASPALLEPIIVEAYGAKTPLMQLGTVSVPEAMMLVVQVWDEGVASAVGKAIHTALGLSPLIEGQTLRIRLPELTQERRLELVKVLKKYAEETKIGIRTLRREAIEEIEAKEKKKELSEDEAHIKKKEIQKITDKFVAEVEEIVTKKEADIKKM
jgi:ribosome recycling factor